MTRRIVAQLLKPMGVDLKKIYETASVWSLKAAIVQRGWGKFLDTLREIQPDLSEQYSIGKDLYNKYVELKLRGLHAFQCSLMLKALERFSEGPLTVVDIGDSAGTHMKYLQYLTRDKYDIDTVSINLDPRAVAKITARGQKAVLCRAEDLDLGADRSIDLFTSFEMIEHLHNPTIFFRRLAMRSSSERMVITVPYLRSSRVGLHNIRNRTGKNVFAEDEHIFELNPGDWSLLMLHSGWKVVYEDIYFQYPVRIFPFSRLLSKCWRAFDFEGFWGAILERDTTFMDRYLDWED